MRSNLNRESLIWIIINYNMGLVGVMRIGYKEVKGMGDTKEFEKSSYKEQPLSLGLR